jgi:opacity protein-like surface antigen
MRRVPVGAIAAASMLAAGAAKAADMPYYQPPLPPPPVEFSGWYLRGDIGITNQKVKKLENVLLPDSARTVNLDFDSAGLFGVGVGYHVNNWLRLDVTGEYRSASDFTGLHVINDLIPYTDEYRAKKTEWLVLANAYVDLGTWWCLTPFVGAGIGASRVTISGFTDVNTVDNGVAFADSKSKWNFAWALHAGAAYQVTNNLALELAYRYTHLGDGITGDVVTYNGINDVRNPTTFKDINSHDLKLGLRWTCCDEPAVPPPPPAPVIYQPPLEAPPIMRKG